MLQTDPMKEIRVYPMEKVFLPRRHGVSPDGRITVVIHTGGVAHAGIPAYVGLDRVIYVGGDQKQLGWRRS